LEYIPRTETNLGRRTS